METKRAGFWKDYSNQIMRMTRSSMQNSMMYALWQLNKAIMNFYNVLSKPHTAKEVQHHAGYLLHAIVLVDSVGRPGSELSYLQEDILDAYDKGMLINIASQISGLAMDHENTLGRALYGSPHDGDFSCSWQTEEQLFRTLRRLLKFIMGEITLPLRDLATQHVAIYYGREPTCE